MAGGTVHEYLGKMTLYAFLTYIIAAATVGFILGHGIGISSVNIKMEEDANTNQYSKFDSAVLTIFINMYSPAALVAMVALFFAYWMTRRFGLKISTHLRNAVFLAINGAVGFPNRAGLQAKINTQSHGPGMQDVGSLSNMGHFTLRDGDKSGDSTEVTNNYYTINLGPNNDPLSQEVMAEVLARNGGVELYLRRKP